MSWKFSHIQNS